VRPAALDLFFLAGHGTGNQEQASLEAEATTQLKARDYTPEWRPTTMRFVNHHYFLFTATMAFRDSITNSAMLGQVALIAHPGPGPHAHPTPATALAFDIAQELLWTGNEYVGRDSVQELG
jgi:hypothetical protein